MRVFSLVLALLAFGCSPTIPVYLSDREPEPVISATLDAVTFWNDVIGFEALSVRMIAHASAGHVEPCAIVVVSVERVDGPDDVRGETTSFGFGQRVEVERSAFTVGPGYLYRADQGVQLVAHELGHALGLFAHSSDRANVMHKAYPSDGYEVTHAQRRKVRALLVSELALAP